MTYGSWCPRVSRSEIRRVSILRVFLSRGWPPGSARRSAGTENPGLVAYLRDVDVGQVLGRSRCDGAVVVAACDVDVALAGAAISSASKLVSLTPHA